MPVEVHLAHRGTAMASPLLIDLSPAGGLHEADRATHDAVAAFEHVAATCSRFIPSGDLCRLNDEPEQFVKVDEWVVEVIEAAVTAYRRTGGRFDPRVIGDLERLGYDVSFSSMRSPQLRAGDRAHRGPWQPRFSLVDTLVNLGGAAIDLGGIAKGWAVDRAIELALRSGAVGLVDLGGDGRVSGPDANGNPWSIGIEDPHGGDLPVATVAMVDGAYATSSIRVRQWSVGGRVVHHLIDPITGEPGGAGLAAVTTLGSRAADVEVDAKVAFLMGSDKIASYCEHHRLAALWVTTAGEISWSPSMADHLTWVRA